MITLYFNDLFLYCRVFYQAQERVGVALKDTSTSVNVSYDAEVNEDSSKNTFISQLSKISR